MFKKNKRLRRIYQVLICFILPFIIVSAFFEALDYFGGYKTISYVILWFVITGTLGDHWRDQEKKEKRKNDHLRKKAMKNLNKMRDKLIEDQKKEDSGSELYKEQQKTIDAITDFVKMED